MTDCPRVEAGANGRAVRLGELIAWVTACDDCAIVDAAERVLLALGKPVPCEVYNDAQNGGYAVRIPIDKEWFATRDGHQLKPRYLSNGIGLGRRDVTKYARSLGHGWAGFTAWLMEMLSDTLKAKHESRDVLPWCVVLQSDARSRLGWVDAAATLVADGVAAPAAAITAEDVTDWRTLVLYRMQFAHLEAQKRSAWLPEHVAILAGQLHEEHQTGKGKGALGRLAKDVGTSRQALRELLVRHKYDTATGLKHAEWFPGASGTKAA